MAKLNESLIDKFKESLKFIKRNPYLLLLLNEKNRFLGKWLQKKYTDEEFVKSFYKKSFNTDLNIKNPKTFNEKLQWLKLYYRDPEMVICADKYEVRNYIKDKGFGHLLNTQIAVFENANDINFNELPDKFVLKGSHGSGWNIICEDKNKFHWYGWRKVMNSWLRQNLNAYGREWVYNEITPRIVCEKFLEVENGELFDYKFFCLNGKVEFIQLTDNDIKSAKINLYTNEWKLMKEKYAYHGSAKQIPKPILFEEMIKIAETLSKPFPFSRIDLYDVNGKIIFGEITFFPSSGFKGFEPKGFDLELGGKLILPEKNYN
jgi:hypothetical protein